MALYLFAGIAVSDFAGALAWYEALLGRPPSFFPNDSEAVWELAEHRSLYVAQRPADAGHAMHTDRVRPGTRMTQSADEAALVGPDDGLHAVPGT
jgi:hypothetical protein